MLVIRDNDLLDVLVEIIEQIGKHLRLVVFALQDGILQLSSVIAEIFAVLEQRLV